MMTSIDHVDSTVEARPDLTEVTKDMSQSQRALELRKFFAPYDPQSEGHDTTGYNKHLNADGALESYAENVVWRLQVARSMISLVDRDVQYFLAGALRDESPPPSTTGLINDNHWFDEPKTREPGGLYEMNFTELTKSVMLHQPSEHTSSDASDEEYPCYIISDLSQNDELRHLDIVNGNLSAYKFYAGTPITTNNGVNIGAFFVLDENPRPQGLLLSQRKYLYRAAKNVMKHLETKREADERRRVSLMSHGMAEFLERTSRITAHDINTSGHIKNGTPSGTRKPKVAVGANETKDHGDRTEDPAILEHREDASLQTLDKIKVTLDHAASILKESLELTVGGVVFLSTALGYRQTGIADAYFDVETDIGAEVADQAARIDGDKNATGDVEPTRTQKANQATSGDSQRTGLSPGQVRGFDDQRRPAKVLAMSKAQTVQWQPDSKVVDGSTLQSLLNTYPQGNVWYMDNDGYFSSLDQANQNDTEAVDQHDRGKATSGDRSNSDARREKPQSTAKSDVARQQAEASLLSKMFQGARQIIFIPLWDAGGDRWHSGCFVWSKSAVPVFTVDSEIAYLSAFTNSVMVEISRLDAITANKMKADFISSISHEFRSPLHGILASAEFLRESQLETTQSEFVSTIQNCGSTLLDTINHVLDYSKINSFEKSGDKGTIMNELYEVSNVALLCEEIINGMIAANEYQNTRYAGHSDTNVRTALNDGSFQATSSDEQRVNIILDFESRDWTYKVQPGALRRVIMNLFGNAQKYTKTGFILVQMRIIDAPEESDRSLAASSSHSLETALGKVLALNIIDSGRGMSSEYMERKLYQPFAQEDSFANGVGLGLSIVWSIVTQIGGKIRFRSELGKGTDAEITIPVEEPESQKQSDHGELHDSTKAEQEAENTMRTVKDLLAGKTAAIWSHTLRPADQKKNRSLGWKCLERYLTQWLGMRLLSAADMISASHADLIIMEKHDDDFSGLSRPFSIDRNKLLVIRDHAAWHEEYRKERRSRSRSDVWTPIGPYKLARVLLALFTNDPPLLSELGRTSSTDSGTQTAEFEGEASSRHRVPKLEKSPSEPSESLRLPIRSGRPTPAAATSFGVKGLRTLSSMHGTPIDSSPPTRGAGLSVPDAEELVISTHLTPSSAASPSASRNVSRTPSFSSEPASNDVSLRLLAVDDNGLNLQLLTRFLRKRKSDQITMAVNGLEALNAVKTLSENAGENFDVIFMDISMPVMDGFDSTSEIRRYEIESRIAVPEKEASGSIDKVLSDNGESQTAAIKKVATGKAHIVALTGLASRRDRDRAVDAGVDDFMTKPVQFAKVGELLKRICNEKSKARS